MIELKTENNKVAAADGRSMAAAPANSFGRSLKNKIKIGNGARYNLKKKKKKREKKAAKIRWVKNPHERA